jgi:hypothetical protein
MENIWLKGGEIDDILLQHIYKMGIISPSHNIKKRNAIMDPLVGILVRENIKKDELIEFINDVESDIVFNIDFFDKGGDVKDFINKKWLNLLMSLWRYRSVGLGTPNAASGEGEFMFIFSSKHITKPTKGDLLVNGKIIELKGEETRVMGKITGKMFRENSLLIVNKFGLIPNKSSVGTGMSRKVIDAAELEKKVNEKYWEEQISTLDINNQMEFINQWLSIIDNKEHYDSVSRIFYNNLFNQPILVKEIVKILYSNMCDTSTFNKFAILEDGSNVKILSNDIDDFNKKVDDGTIIINGDYFRINQDLNIGWYIK